MIDDKCVDSNTWHDEVSCFRCLPDEDQNDWSVVSGKCYIEGECYSSGQPTGEECRVCDPSSPYQAAPAADGDSCDDDGDPCTADLCGNGVCTHAPGTGGACDDGDVCTKNDTCAEGVCAGQTYECLDGLDCTEDSCNGDGTCTFTPVGGSCLIDGVCHQDGALEQGGCMECNISISQVQWSPLADEALCSDGNGCTVGDKCAQGVCAGEPKRLLGRS